jgi:hypothetical protein
LRHSSIATLTSLPMKSLTWHTYSGVHTDLIQRLNRYT